MRALGSAVLFSLLLAACGRDAEPAARPAPSVFIAFARDFAAFEEWTRFDRGEDRVPPTHLGRTSAIYVDRLPSAGASAFPVGTRIVRVERDSGDPGAWEVHAMVKRGGGFNAGGARGWEFFELTLDRTRRRPSIRWRGEGPANGDGYRAPEGGGDVLGCNHCHGAATWNDSVLSPALDLSRRERSER